MKIQYCTITGYYAHLYKTVQVKINTYRKAMKDMSDWEWWSKRAKCWDEVLYPLQWFGFLCCNVGQWAVTVVYRGLTVSYDSPCPERTSSVHLYSSQAKSWNEITSAQLTETMRQKYQKWTNTEAEGLLGSTLHADPNSSSALWDPLTVSL